MCEHELDKSRRRMPELTTIATAAAMAFAYKLYSVDAINLS